MGEISFESLFRADGFIVCFVMERTGIRGLDWDCGYGVMLHRGDVRLGQVRLG